MPSRNEYEYDDAEPGMQSAVERARQGFRDPPDDDGDGDSDGSPSGGTMQLPEMDFSGGSDEDKFQDFPTGSDPIPAHAETLAEKAQRKGDENDEEGGAPTARYAGVAAQNAKPVTPAPPDGEYKSALSALIARLKQPTQDYSQGYGEALKKDASENHTNRILDYLSQGLRRAPTATLSPAATNAADFLKLQSLRQSQSGGELARLGSLAKLAKPTATKDTGDTEKLRAYLVKVGAGSPEELAGMSAKELMNVKEIYGLKHKIDREPVEDARAEQFHQDNQANVAAQQAHTAAMEALALRNEGKLPASEAKDLGGSDAALKAIDSLSKDWEGKASGIGSIATQYLPGSEASTYSPNLKATTQIVGKYLEGGKLTDSDMPKYAAMMPQPGEPQNVKDAKIATLKRLIAEKRASEGQALAGSGYKVPSGDLVTLRARDGRTKKVSRAVAEQFMREHPGEASIQ
jgi:hypothetical protein